MTREELARLLAKENDTQSELDSLEEREMEVVSMLASGLPEAQMCLEMGIDRQELNALKKRIQKKFGLRDEIQLMRFAAKYRL